MSIINLKDVTFISHKKDKRSDLILMLAISKTQYNKLNENIDEGHNTNWWVYDRQYVDEETGETLTDRHYYLKFRKPKQDLESFATGDKCDISMTKSFYQFKPKDKDTELLGWTTKLYHITKVIE